MKPNSNCFSLRPATREEASLFYGEALIQQYGGELTDYGLLTRADGQPVQKPLPPQPGLNSMGMRCP